MTLKKITETLNEQSQFKLALDLVEKALPIWKNYAAFNKLAYQDSVTGMHHVVRKDILHRALEALRKELTNPESQATEIEGLREEFSDPIVAMQDFDWELPYPVERTFYALRNLLDKAAGQNCTSFGESQIYLVINQAIDALEKAKVLSESEIRAVFKKYIVE